MANELIGIDIAHGENTFDSGSKGVRVDGVGYEEHHFSAKLAEKLDILLKHNGFRTCMAQKPYENDVPLHKRTEYYNRMKCDLGFSGHANAGSPTARGLCAFYWGTNQSSKKAAEYYAKLVGDYGYPKYSGGLEASVIGSWTNFHMTRETDMPWLLTENGFMTNSEDFVLIFKSDKFINDLAEIHAKVACNFFGRAFKPLSSGEANTTPNAPKPENKPVLQPGNKLLVLPANADSWSIYPTNKAPIKANAISSLNPKKYGGLQYDIIGNPQADVYTIKTQQFGVVNIFAASFTGAKIISAVSVEVIKPVAKPTVKKKYVALPASADEWRIYPTNKAPVKANALANRLKPSKFNGLEYEIIGSPQKDVYTIKTGQFGTVNIYAAPSTGAKVITK